MGKLALAGVVSGLGQGLQQGFTQMQGGIIQQGLLESSQDFQTAKLKEQMAHAEKLHAQSEAGATARLSTTEGSAERRQTENLKHIETQTKMQIDKMVELRGIEKEERLGLDKDAMRVACLTLKAQKNGAVSITPVSDPKTGEVNLSVLMKDGSSHLAKDEQGNLLHGLKDVSETAKIIAGTQKAIIEHTLEDVTRQGAMMDPQLKADSLRWIKVLEEKMTSGLRPGAIPPSQPSPRKIVDPLKAPIPTPEIPSTSGGVLQQGSVTAPGSDEELADLLDRIQQAESGQ